MLFRKGAFFTDIHFGKSSDSEVHNQDNIRYLEWFCEHVAVEKCDTVFFLGDWFDNQVKIRKDTNAYSDRALRMLNDLGIPVYMLVGNHDMYYKTSREFHALIHVDQFPNLHLIDSLTTKDGVLMAPYLVTDEFAVLDDDVKYVLGHFALPGFLTNETYEWPDKGAGLHGNDFLSCDYVFSGHFHKRQQKHNEHGIPLCYIGNCFPHNFNDVNDRERGCMLFEWGSEPWFLTWNEAPNYNRIKLSTLMEMIDGDGIQPLFNEWSVIECADDMGIEVDDALHIKEAMQEHVRDFKLKPMTDAQDGSEEVDLAGVDLQNADQMVRHYLKEIDTADSDYDSQLLEEIYDGAEITG